MRIVRKRCSSRPHLEQSRSRESEQDSGPKVEIRDIAILTDNQPGGICIFADPATAKRLPVQNWLPNTMVPLHFNFSVEIAKTPVRARARVVRIIPPNPSSQELLSPSSIGWITSKTSRSSSVSGCVVSRSNRENFVKRSEPAGRIPHAPAPSRRVPRMSSLALFAQRQASNTPRLTHKGRSSWCSSTCRLLPWARL